MEKYGIESISFARVISRYYGFNKIPNEDQCIKFLSKCYELWTGSVLENKPNFSVGNFVKYLCTKELTVDSKYDSPYYRYWVDILGKEEIRIGTSNEIFTPWGYYQKTYNEIYEELED